MSELSWRPLRRDDVGQCADLLAAAEAVDRTGENLDAAEPVLARDLAVSGS